LGCSNSFTGNTPVLMADGTSKPIDQVHVGDTVANAPPGALLGSSDEQHTVTAVHVTREDRAYTDVTINTGHGAATISGTAYHLYWDATTRAWTPANHLRIGDHLQSTNGAPVVIVALHDYTATMVTYNLTIDNLHTYYVLAGSAPVLVHNSTCIKLFNDLSAAQAANPLIESLHDTGSLPANYVTKNQAAAAGWSPGKALGNYIPGGQIGGDEFNNSSNLLPAVPGRVWYEADVGINPMVSRAKQPGWRLLYSNDGLAYVTSDHYKSTYQLSNWN
jgi:hypothetical protein